MRCLASVLVEPVAESSICVRRKPVATLLASVFVEPAVAALCQRSAVLDVPGILQLVLGWTGILRAVTPVPKLVLDRIEVFQVSG